MIDYRTFCRVILVLCGSEDLLGRPWAKDRRHIGAIGHDKPDDQISKVSRTRSVYHMCLF